MSRRSSPGSAFLQWVALLALGARRVRAGAAAVAPDPARDQRVHVPGRRPGGADVLLGVRAPEPAAARARCDPLAAGAPAATRPGPGVSARSRSARPAQNQRRRATSAGGEGSRRAREVGVAATGQLDRARRAGCLVGRDRVAGVGAGGAGAVADGRRAARRAPPARSASSPRCSQTARRCSSSLTPSRWTRASSLEELHEQAAGARAALAADGLADRGRALEALGLRQRRVSSSTRSAAQGWRCGTCS